MHFTWYGVVVGVAAAEVGRQAAAVLQLPIAAWPPAHHQSTLWQSQLQANLILTLLALWSCLHDDSRSAVVAATLWVRLLATRSGGPWDLAVFQRLSVAAHPTRSHLTQPACCLSRCTSTWVQPKHVYTWGHLHVRCQGASTAATFLLGTREDDTSPAHARLRLPRPSHYRALLRRRLHTLRLAWVLVAAKALWGIVEGNQPSEAAGQAGQPWPHSLPVSPVWSDVLRAVLVLGLGVTSLLELCTYPFKL